MNQEELGSKDTVELVTNKNGSTKSHTVLKGGLQLHHTGWLPHLGLNGQNVGDPRVSSSSTTTHTRGWGQDISQCQVRESATPQILPQHDRGPVAVRHDAVDGLYSPGPYPSLPYFVSLHHTPPTVQIFLVAKQLYKRIIFAHNIDSIKYPLAIFCKKSIQ